MPRLTKEIARQAKRPVQASAKLFEELQQHTKKLEETVFPTRDGHALMAHHYVPKTETRTKLLFLHGIDGSKSVRQYQVLFHRLAQEGIEVFVYDQRGHGKTKPEFDVDKMQSDVADVLEALKKRGVEEIAIASHSLGGSLAVGGLLIASREKRDIPRISMFIPYAPPRNLMNLTSVATVLSAFDKIDSWRLPSPLKKALASSLYAWRSPRYDVPRRAAQTLLRAFSFRSLHGDKMKLRDMQHMKREFQRVPNFVTTLARLKRRKILPPTLVLFGTHDQVVETHNEEKLLRYKQDLEKLKINVRELPFSHIPPVISVGGERDMFDLSDSIANILAALLRRGKQ